MTNNEITPDEPEIATPAEVELQEPAEQQADNQAGTKADREAKLRKRAQDAETERDQLREVLGGLRRGEVERRLTGTLTNPADVWHTVGVEELLDESGALDAAKIDAAAEAIQETHPNWLVPRGLPGNQRPAGPVAQMQESSQEDRWRGAFAPRT